MKRIIVPVDFSANANSSVKFAAKLAGDTGARVTMLHVFETPVVFSGAAMMTTADLDYTTLYNNALSRLKKYYQKVRRNFTGVKVDLSVHHGLPSARIMELALEQKADMIIMGTTGKGTIEKLMLGTNAARLISDAPCKVLVVPPGSRYRGMGKIVYTTDLTDESLSHARDLIPLAKALNSEIQFLFINDDMDAFDSNLKEVTRKIKSKVRYPKISGYVCSDSDVNKGIMYFIKKYKSNCLVMYTHHRNLIASFYHRSKTRKMAAHLNIPLLVMHEQDLPLRG